MVLGILCTLCGCAWLWTITFFHTAPMQVIGPAILIGIGGAILIVTSLAMATDLIGAHAVSLSFSSSCMAAINNSLVNIRAVELTR